MEYYIYFLLSLVNENIVIEMFFQFQFSMYLDIICGMHSKNNVYTKYVYLSVCPSYKVSMYPIVAIVSSKAVRSYASR